jgi:protein-L-isoaspartate O-methyltransferase
VKSEPPIYNAIGHGYAKTRAPDHRITSRLIALLDLPAHATVLDVGAGTGKYSRALAEKGYSLIALEPSEVMQAQGNLIHGCGSFGRERRAFHFQMTRQMAPW